MTRSMKSGNAYQFARLSDAIYDGRNELGYSIENDTAGFDAFARGDFLGTFATRKEARAAIIAAHQDTEERAAS